MESQRKTVSGYGSVKMHLLFILYTDYCKREMGRLIQLQSKIVFKSDIVHMIWTIRNTITAIIILHYRNSNGSKSFWVHYVQFDYDGW